MELQLRPLFSAPQNYSRRRGARGGGQGCMTLQIRVATPLFPALFGNIFTHASAKCENSVPTSTFIKIQKNHLSYI